MNAMPESESMSRRCTASGTADRNNHHQTGPAGTVIFAPPFRDPNNYFFDPLVVDGLSLVGAAMHSRFSAEGKGGVVERDGASYQTWWNGGLRTTAYFHNIIGILTEAIGNPTPISIPLVPDRQLASGDLPLIAPSRGASGSRSSRLTANRAILDLASRYHETFLYNICVMGEQQHRAGQPTAGPPRRNRRPQGPGNGNVPSGGQERAASECPAGSAEVGGRQVHGMLRLRRIDTAATSLPSDQ
jgi:hypothetical protein